jgi:tetratricopeptide (TPR) repeat protein
MTKGAQVALVLAFGLGSAATLALAIVFMATGDRFNVAWLVLASMLGLIAITLSSNAGRRFFFPILAVLWVGAFVWRNFINGNGPVLIALLLPPLVIVVVFGTLILRRRRMDAIHRKALEFINGGEPDKAIGFLEEKARELGPSETMWNALSVAYGAAKKWPEALRSIDEAIDLGGPQPLYINNKGMLLFQSGQAKQALPLLEHCVRVEPTNWLRICNLGMVQAELGDRSAASRSLRAAEQLMVEQSAADRPAHDPPQPAIEELRRKIGAGTSEGFELEPGKRNAYS